ncbi:MAG: tetratricopeptide repeat protein [Bacteroidia bacterium]
MNIKELLDSGNFAEVIMQTSNSTNADELQWRAFAFQKSGEFETAMDVWNQLILRLPEAASFYNERGVCKFNLRFKHSLDDFDKAISLEPENPYYWACRAYVRDKLGKTEEAVADYQKAHDLDPEDATILNNLGLAEQKLGYTSRARERFKKSNDLIGFKEEELEPEAETTLEKTGWKARWAEVGKMLSSRKEFKKFLKELFE